MTTVMSLGARTAVLPALVLLAGCSAGLDASPPGRPETAAWAIDRQVARCRATQSGGTRAGMAGGGGLVVFGAVTAVSRTGNAEDCPSVLALTDEDVGEIRTLALAAAASARGMETNWQSRAGARREIVLSVYPAEASRGRPCRIVAATLTVYGPAPEALVGAPPPVPLDEQRFCRSPAGPWEPA
ncbi:MAG: hypothetical protein Q8O26_19280 [Phreatobacter sp.]|uniref:hypothetical protein n=1 Tax=Phreatobacter sp. TaxID=1966341 RepID=UPI002736BA91|nr:hypothetical protein [Phreatobacter sp.]MDP2804018.1 hypothetical protein [Phreatobacter sp.]